MIANVSDMVDRGVELDYDSIEEAFPSVDCGHVPFGSWVLVQKRSPMTRTRGGLELPDETQQTEFWNTQVCKVIALGPVAYKNRDTLEPWPEGDWVKPEGTLSHVESVLSKFQRPGSDRCDHG